MSDTQQCWESPWAGASSEQVLWLQIFYGSSYLLSPVLSTSLGSHKVTLYIPLLDLVQLQAELSLLPPQILATVRNWCRKVTTIELFTLSSTLCFT